jgi:trehalose 6-phosphate synthase/phosphatase
MEDYKYSEITEAYKKADMRLVLLDYDGTLIDYTPIPGTHQLTDHLSDILKKLEGSSKTDLYIITGRSHKEIDLIFRDLQVNIISDHGAMIKESGIWKKQVINNCFWKETIYPILKQVTSECPGSFIEGKDCSLAWHYRSAESNCGYIHSRRLISILGKTIHLYKLKLLDGNKVVEILPEETGKGKAAERLFNQKIYDFILSIGDDVTDEEVFKYFLNISNAYTIKVGGGDTSAKYEFTGIGDVISLLKHISL